MTAIHTHLRQSRELGCCCGGACACRSLSGRQRFLAAIAGGAVDRPPVWFMRQAGRHLPGYRALRERYAFLDLCRDPAANRQVSAEPVHRYGIDAAIVFNDILIPLADMGMEVDFVPAPRFGGLVESVADVRGLASPRFGPSTDVCRCLNALRDEIGPDTGMLGFIGAPFTVASFAIAGAGPQRAGRLADHVASKSVTFAALQHRLVEVLADYAAAQACAGADAIQVFESLALELDPASYRSVGLPFLAAVVARIRERTPQTPVIVFGRGLWEFIPAIADAGATAISLDSTHPLSEARRMLRSHGRDTALQGNLAPETLLLEPDAARAAAQSLLEDWSAIVPHPDRAAELGPTGWVFNLGHGVPESASPDTVQAVVDAVRNFRIPSAPKQEARS